MYINIKINNKTKKIMNTFGLITLISATTMALIALPLQAIKHYREKKIGLHPSLLILSWIVYLSRALFALTNTDGIIWYIMISDAIGTIVSSFMLLQIWWYRKG